jgi:hypothetical protein
MAPEQQLGLAGWGTFLQSVGWHQVIAALSHKDPKDVVEGGYVVAAQVRMGILELLGHRFGGGPVPRATATTVRR